MSDRGVRRVVRHKRTLFKTDGEFVQKAVLPMAERFVEILVWHIRDGTRVEVPADFDASAEAARLVRHMTGQE